MQEDPAPKLQGLLGPEQRLLLRLRPQTAETAGTAPDGLPPSSRAHGTACTGGSVITRGDPVAEFRQGNEPPGYRGEDGAPIEKTATASLQVQHTSGRRGQPSIPGSKPVPVTVPDGAPRQANIPGGKTSGQVACPPVALGFARGYQKSPPPVCPRRVRRRVKRLTKGSTNHGTKIK